MAKDNLFLGFGRGKVGDVVFYRRDGQQIARARNRAPRNPNTFKQQLQRAVSANVQRLYSTGMQVFNHSFEGYKVGEGNQREFVKQNMNKLRSLLVADYNLERTDTDCLGRFGAPGLTIPVPFDGMIISNGSVQQTLFTFDSTDGFEMVEPLRNQQEAIQETIGHYALRVGLVPGDIYTFVAFGCDPLQGAELAYFGPTESYTKYAAIYPQLFGYSQFRVKEGITEDTTPISNITTLGAFFESGSAGADLTSRNAFSYITPQAIDTRMATGLIGCIRSREDSGVRSPSSLYVLRSTYDFGLTVNYLEAAWGARAKIAGSDLILEGSEFMPAESPEVPMTITTTPTLPSEIAASGSITLSLSRPITDSEVSHIQIFVGNEWVTPVQSSNWRWDVLFMNHISGTQSSLTVSNDSTARVVSGVRWVD